MINNLLQYQRTGEIHGQTHTHLAIVIEPLLKVSVNHKKIGELLIFPNNAINLISNTKFFCFLA